MKFVKYLALAMMALSLGSCLNNDDDEKGYTVTFSDFLAVGADATTVMTDDDDVLQVSNPSSLKFSDGTIPNRVIANFSMEYDQAGKLKSNYIEIKGAQRCYIVPCVSKEDVEEEKEFKLSRPKSMSMTKKYLNLYVEGYFGSNVSETDFHLYVDRVDGANVFLTHTCKAYRSQIVPASGKISLIINNDQETLITYEWK